MHPSKKIQLYSEEGKFIVRGIGISTRKKKKGKATVCIPLCVSNLEYPHSIISAV